ncbi:hypothetical protein [Microcystis phage Mae-JY35]
MAETMNRPKHARPATKADETPEFVAFWEVWQKVRSDYEGRASARDAFFRHVWWKGADPQDIVDGARLWADKFRAGSLRMKADTWLERGAWEDDSERWRKHVREIEAKKAAQTGQTPAPASNVHILHKQDNRPTEEERARHAQAVLARAGLAAQG